MSSTKTTSKTRATDMNTITCRIPQCRKAKASDDDQESQSGLRRILAPLASKYWRECLNYHRQLQTFVPEDNFVVRCLLREKVASRANLYVLLCPLKCY